jgi:uncharacterized membrane protein
MGVGLAESLWYSFWMVLSAVCCGVDAVFAKLDRQLKQLIQMSALKIRIKSSLVIIFYSIARYITEGQIC